MVTASSVGVELFYRAAVQTGVLRPFVPFAQAFAAVITADLIVPFYYVAASPKDSTYVVAPVQRSRSAHEDLKKLFTAWYERRQMKKYTLPFWKGDDAGENVITLAHTRKKAVLIHGMICGH
ncbi:hypothetical protein CRYUN_Cryun07bG0185500 [Craigia yunnanensis]